MGAASVFLEGVRPENVRTQLRLINFVTFLFDLARLFRESYNLLKNTL
jgi:hypothetical protein